MKEAACKTDLGPLIRKLLEQQQEIEHLRAELQNAYDLTKTITAERDEARRRLCIWAQDDAHGDGREYAREQGWDCFPQEDGK